MPILWPLKVPERGNAITQRKTLEIEHSCLFIHHTIWIYPFPHLILFNTPQKSLLKSSNPSQIFGPQKIPQSKISNPKISFKHPRHLKSRVPPPPAPLGLAIRYEGRLFKISLSRCWFYIRCHFPISIFFRLGKARWYCVRKGRSFLRADLFLCCRAVFLSANFTSERYFLKIAAG